MADEAVKQQNWSQVGQRRSQRVLLRLPVVVEGASSQGQPFQEDTHTLVVNAHGALLLLATEVQRGQALVLTNKHSREKQECRVAYQGKSQDGKRQVALEFQHPLPGFWGIAFPPDDWKFPTE